MRSVLLAISALTLSLPALAQEAPRLFPSRDVAVTYRVSGDGQGLLILRREEV